MSLRTQVSPYTLIGNLSDLPNPASVAQGHLFHAADTGDCLVLVIDPATGIRSWQEFCGVTGITGVQGPAILNWAGGANIAVTPSFFIGNTPDASSVNAVGGVVPAYPLARARTALNFSINLRSNPGAGNVTVEFLVNGLIQMIHTFVGVTSGRFTVSGPVTVPPGSTIDVAVVAAGNSGTVLVSATVELF